MRERRGDDSARWSAGMPRHHRGKMELGLDWRKKAIILFIVIMLALSILLIVLVTRAANMEKLLMEQEVESEQRKLAELTVSHAAAILSALEQRINTHLRPHQVDWPQSPIEALTQPCSHIMQEEKLVIQTFLIDQSGAQRFPSARLPYALTPSRRNIEADPEALTSDSRWTAAEVSEFGTKDYLVAAGHYRALMDATSTDTNSSYQGVLLHRIARCYKKSGKYREAIEAYQKLLREYADEQNFDAIPLGLTAYYQLGDIYLKTDRKPEGVEVFLRLYNALLNSTWQLTRSQFHFYLKRVDDILAASLTEVASSESNTELGQRWDRLKRLEGETINRANIIENLRQKIMPRIQTRIPDPLSNSGTFHRISETIEGMPYLISYRLIGDTALGVVIDTGVMSKAFLPARLNTLPLRSGWYVQVTDRLGNRLAGADVTHLKDVSPQLTHSRSFDGSLPTWEVRIYQSHPGLPQRLARLKGNIYVLCVVVVISVVVFGGYWGIRSAAKEMTLAHLKSDFVSTVSHELRTPLTSIQYLAELLHRGRVSDEERKQQYYETLTHESQHLSRLVDNILDFSRIEAGMKTYHLVETPIDDLAREVASQFQQRVAQDGFTIEDDISHQMPAITADKAALSQALHNLLDNAAKYAGESRRIRLSAWSDEENVFLAVQDEGIGIRKEEQEQIFEKFYRSEHLPANSIRGTGIGLTLVCHIVEAHGGHVLLESELGKGTKVVMKLPVRRKVDTDGQNPNH